MKWMKERDLLIAQTMAFVQSVTGKTPDAPKPPEAIRAPETPGTPEMVPLPAVPLAVETFESARPAALPLPEIALPVIPPPAARLAAAMPAPAAEAQPRVVKAPVIDVPAEAPREISSPAPFTRLDLRGDFQSEIRARVASYRAHQERFSRQREAYCAATMAKGHAVLKDGDQPPPRPEK
jgi:hypothetical protein